MKQRRLVQLKPEAGKDKWLFGGVNMKQDRRWEEPGSPGVSAGRFTTNLFDVIASLGAGLYVHHIELASFPLCRLYRDLPATVPGGGWWGGGGGWGVDVEGKHKNNQDDMNGRGAKKNK